MLKKLALSGLLVVSVVSMAGCTIEEQKIVYKGKSIPVSEAEERIADQLEVDNPDMDIEVDIYEEDDE